MIKPFFLPFTMSFLMCTSCFATEALNCNSVEEGYALSAKLDGLWLSDVTFTQNSELITRQRITIVPTKSFDMIQSSRFPQELPYPTYSLSGNGRSIILALPMDDLRNYEFVALLFTEDGEIELNCTTSTIQ